MTRLTQGNGEGQVEEVIHFPSASKNLCEELAKGDLVMVRVNGYCFAISVAVACSALLAGVIIASKYGVTPFDVAPGFSQQVGWPGHSTFPVVVPVPTLSSVSFNQGQQILSGSLVMVAKVARYTVGGAVHVRLNDDWFSASTLAKVFALIFRYPFVHALIIGMGVVAWVASFKSPTLCKAAEFVFSGSEHTPHDIRFNGETQETLGELLEPLPGSAEGNQQPSAVNGVRLTAKVQRLASEEPTNNLAYSAQPTMLWHAKPSTVVMI